MFYAHLRYGVRAEQSDGTYADGHEVEKHVKTGCSIADGGKAMLTDLANQIQIILDNPEPGTDRHSWWTDIPLKWVADALGCGDECPDIPEHATLAWDCGNVYDAYVPTATYCPVKGCGMYLVPLADNHRCRTNGG